MLLQLSFSGPRSSCPSRRPAKCYKVGREVLLVEQECGLSFLGKHWQRYNPADKCLVQKACLNSPSCWRGGRKFGMAVT
jgi:hypothetical protein